MGYEPTRLSLFARVKILVPCMQDARSYYNPKTIEVDRVQRGLFSVAGIYAHDVQRLHYHPVYTVTRARVELASRWQNGSLNSLSATSSTLGFPPELHFTTKVPIERWYASWNLVEESLLCDANARMK